MRINVDSDGVVYDWHGWMTQFMSQKLDLEIQRWDTWDMAAQLGVDKPTWNKAFDKSVAEGCFVFGEAIPGAIAGLQALVDAGHQVRIVTAKQLRGNFKTFKAQSDFLVWFSQFGFLDKVEIVFTGSKFGKNGYPAEMVVDDKPDLSWVQPSPAVNVLFDQPWNQTGLTNVARVGQDPNYENPTIYRAVGWTDVLELAEQMGGGLLLDKSPVVY